jgi:hypothetical protein
MMFLPKNSNLSKKIHVYKGNFRYRWLYVQVPATQSVHRKRRNVYILFYNARISLTPKSDKNIPKKKINMSISLVNMSVAILDKMLTVKSISISEDRTS